MSLQLNAEGLSATRHLINHSVLDRMTPEVEPTCILHNRLETATLVDVFISLIFSLLAISSIHLNLNLKQNDR